MNSYATIEYADAYLSGFLETEAWMAAAVEIKQRALTTATACIDGLASRYPGFRGRKNSPDQPQEFPRTPYTEVPEAVKQACCHEAVFLARISSNKTARRRRDNIRQGLRSESIGDVSESYADNLPAADSVASELAINLLRPFMALGGCPLV